MSNTVKLKVAPKKPVPKNEQAAKLAMAKDANKSPDADKPKPKKVTIKQQMIDMLHRPDGATDAELVKKFGWKGNHVARGQRSILGKEYREKKTGLMLCKFTRTPSGDTAYKIEPIENAQSKTEA